MHLKETNTLLWQGILNTSICCYSLQNNILFPYFATMGKIFSNYLWLEMELGILSSSFI